MKYFSVVLFALLVTSCAKEEPTDKGNENLPIILSATFANEADGSAQTGTAIKAASSSQSRATATAFEGGDELGLFVVKSGMEVQGEGNLVNNHKMVVGGDGVIKGTPTAVYYPTQQGTSSLFKTNLYSYYPYQSGDATADALGVLVGIRTDQTDFSYLKRSDLCYGSAHDIAPSKAAQPLSFKHSFSQVRVNVTLFSGCPSIKQLRLINIKDSARLNIQSGALTLKNHTTEVLTYPNAANSPTSFTAIIPAQTLAGACIAIDLTDPTDPTDLDKGETYIYNAVNPINLIQSATNTLNLSVNDKGVITLNGEPTISAWGNNSNSGNLSESVNNQISLYWLAPHADYATADKITLSTTDQLGVIRDIDLTPTVDPASSLDYAVYKLNLALSGTTYPLVINRIRVHKGATLLRDCPAVTLSGKVLHKTGLHTLGVNLMILISKNKWENVVWQGANENITISSSGATDWSAKSDNPDLSITKSGNTATLTWAENTNGALATTTRTANITFSTIPEGVTTILTATQLGVRPPANSVRIAGLWWSTMNVGASSPTGYGGYYSWTNRNACPSGWRVPTKNECQALIVSGYYWTSYNGINGCWFGPNASSANSLTAIFIPASGYRHTGVYHNIGNFGYVCTSTPRNATNSFYLNFGHTGGASVIGNFDPGDLPVRCVQD